MSVARRPRAVRVREPNMRGNPYAHDMRDEVRDKRFRPVRNGRPQDRSPLSWWNAKVGLFAHAVAAALDGMTDVLAYNEFERKLEECRRNPRQPLLESRRREPVRLPADQEGRRCRNVQPAGDPRACPQIRGDSEEPTRTLSTAHRYRVRNGTRLSCAPACGVRSAPWTFAENSQEPAQIGGCFHAGRVRARCFSNGTRRGAVVVKNCILTSGDLFVRLPRRSAFCPTDTAGTLA
jgi:hypothetical protein